MFEEPAEDFIRALINEERLDEENITKLMALITKFGMPIVRRLGSIAIENGKSLYLINLSIKLSENAEWREIAMRLQEEDKH